MSDGSTSGEWYTERLRGRSSARWKQLIPNPYRRNIRRMKLGRVLDIGCGIGRCLTFNDGNGVGIDHNPASVASCRELGLEAYTPDEFDMVDRGVFDSILLSHVLEHLDEVDGSELVARYLPRLADNGRIVLITPQSAGQRSDPTHVRSIGKVESVRLLGALGVVNITTRSHPFPALVGKVFRHNENIAVGTVLRGQTRAD